MPVYQGKCPQTVRRGSSGNAVKWLQERLIRNSVPPDGGIDGQFGPGVETALRAYQEKNKLEVDGICGPATWNSIMNGGNRLIHYMQNAQLYGNVMYSAKNDKTQTIARCGCGPTSGAIVLSAFMTSMRPPSNFPVETAGWSVKNGHCYPPGGSYWSLFGAIAPKYGRKCQQTGDVNTIKQAFRDGKIVIASMGAPAYTSGGHFIVVRDYDPYNKLFYTIDPISVQRNSCTEDIMKLIPAGQCKQWWIIS